jgi:sugar phosphate isomerase/epimerase
MRIRYLVQVSALCALIVPQLSAMTSIPAKYKISGFPIGPQLYSFKELTTFEAIDKAVETGAKTVEFMTKQKLSPDRTNVIMGPDMSDDDIAYLKAKLKKSGLLAVSYGVVNLRSEEQWRKLFEFAKKLDLYSISTESVDQLDTIEKLVKEYDIRVGIHNHGRRTNDANYKVWDPKYVLSVVQNRDKRIGACADTGHWVTSYLDPLEGIRILKGRIISLHLKDKDIAGPQGHCVPFGTGVGKDKEILDELKAQGFKGFISIEYEWNWGKNVPDVKQCIDFVRAWGAK